MLGFVQDIFVILRWFKDFWWSFDSYKMFLWLLNPVSDRAINPSRRFRPSEETDSLYTYTMMLTIIDVKESDFGNYSCQARNSLGTTMGTMELFSKNLF